MASGWEAQQAPTDEMLERAGCQEGYPSPALSFGALAGPQASVPLGIEAGKGKGWHEREDGPIQKTLLLGYLENFSLRFIPTLPKIQLKEQRNSECREFRQVLQPRAYDMTEDGVMGARLRGS
jgi:hypothetical protein